MVDEVGDEAGAERPVGVLGDGLEGLGKLSRYLIERAIGLHGELAPDAASVVALRRHTSRDDMLRQLVVSMAPTDINPEHWLRWMAGGEEPYAAPVLKKPTKSTQPNARVLDRSSDKVETKRRELEESRSRLDAAQADYGRAEAALARAKAMDNAILQWVVSEHLAGILAPLFAMGPAWTLMRVCSANVSPSEIAAEVEGQDADGHEMLIRMLTADRLQMSRRILASLDLWAGDDEFEHELRLAIDAVVQRFEPRSAERASKNERSRSRRDMVESVRPSSAMDRRAVLDGFAEAAPEAG